MKKEKILIIEEDDDIRNGLKILLESEGYVVATANNGLEGIKKARESSDLVLLDIMMPGLSGIETCKKIREESFVPIIFLTAKATDIDKVLGLSVGGDDYLIKPFSYIELMARVRALLRRNNLYNNESKVVTQEEWIKKSGIDVNTRSNEVLVNNEPIYLTNTEYKILLLLIANSAKTFSAQNIFESVWEEPYVYSSSNTVMVHIKNLRAKMKIGQNGSALIRTVWGRGYKFEER